MAQFDAMQTLAMIRYAPALKDDGKSFWELENELEWV